MARTWEHWEDIKLYSLFRHGEPFRHCAAVLGRSADSCQHRVEIMHWSKAPTWTDADHELLHELLTRQKLSYWRAARRMKRGIDSVRREAYKLGIRSPYATGAASGRPWTIEEETRLIRLREAHRSWEDTAAAMGRTVKACKERISHKLAGQMADRLLKPVTRTLHPRLCLGPLCKNKADRTFQSTGIENRICNSCKIAMHNLHEGMV